MGKLIVQLRDYIRVWEILSNLRLVCFGLAARKPLKSGNGCQQKFGSRSRKLFAAQARPKEDKRAEPTRFASSSSDKRRRLAGARRLLEGAGDLAKDLLWTTSVSESPSRSVAVQCDTRVSTVFAPNTEPTTSKNHKNRHREPTLYRLRPRPDSIDSES